FCGFLGWRWICFVAGPPGARAAWLRLRRYHEPPREGAREPIDYLGAVLLTRGSTLLLLGLLEGGSSWAWASPASVGVLGAAVVLLGVFAAHARRTRYPVVDLAILRRRVVGVSTAISLLVGVDRKSTRLN